MRRLASEVLRDLEIRVASLEKSAVYYPSLENSLDPLSSGFSVEEGSDGQPVYDRHYKSRMSPILSMARGFKAGQRLNKKEVRNLIRSLYKEGESTCMVSASFKAKDFSTNNERSYANRRSEEQYYDEVADKMDDRDEIIIGKVGVFWFPVGNRGPTGSLIY